MKTTALLAIMIILATGLQAQTRVINGKLTAFSTFPVKNVEINSVKAKSTTVSDAFGNFSIVCQENDVIKIRAKAFNPVKQKVGPEMDSLSFNLHFIDSESNRAIATGYGYMNARDLNYAVSHLEQENNEFCSYTDIFDLIKGQFSGVQVDCNGILIRGGNTSFTRGTSYALYVVDNQTTSDIDWIQPCQVLTIDILKDSNGAIYGSRGGNGVVIIETMK